jgi:beta-xylosidase
MMKAYSLLIASLLICLGPVNIAPVVGAQSDDAPQRHGPNLAVSEAFFYDEFDEDSLAAEWFWVREDPDNWSLTERPGFLRIHTQWGTIYEDQIGSNLLLRTTPTSSYRLSTRVEFDATQDYQEAALFLYRDDDNYIVVNRLYHTTFGGHVYGFGREENGIGTEGFWAVASGQIAELQLTVSDTHVTGSYKDETGQWVELGRIQFDGLANYPFIAIAAYHGCLDDQPPSIPADFDFVRVSRGLLRQYLPVIRRDS